MMPLTKPPKAGFKYRICAGQHYARLCKVIEYRKVNCTALVRLIDCWLQDTDIQVVLTTSQMEI
jgi:hypothetical protein